MSTPYEINVFVADSVDSMTGIESLIRKSDRILGQHGALLNVPAQLWFDEREEEKSVDPQEVSGIDDVIQHISTWPALGSVDYSLGGAISLDVGFSRCSTGMVLLGISFDGKTFRDHPESLPQIVTLVHALHVGLNAVRSSFGWGLTDSSNDEDEETERLALKIVVGTPWLDLLRHDLVTPEHLKWLNAEQGPETTLQRTASGGLVWQRDAGPP